MLNTNQPRTTRESAHPFSTGSRVEPRMGCDEVHNELTTHETELRKDIR